MMMTKKNEDEEYNTRNKNTNMTMKQKIKKRMTELNKMRFTNDQQNIQQKVEIQIQPTVMINKPMSKKELVIKNTKQTT